MDRDVDTVAMLVEYLDHLLVGLLALRIGNRHTYQSTELAHTMIDMHHEITYLELLDLLQREGHLTTAGLVALEVVFMETIENLMIGKDTDVQVVVGKALVEGLIDRGKDDLLGLLGKDILQTFILFLAVGKDKDLIALQQIVLERLCQQVEVLMEERLDSDMETEGSLGLRGRTMADIDATEGLGIAHELRSCDQLRLLAHLLFYLMALHLCGFLHSFHPGLGGEIVTDKFRSQFTDKAILENGEIIPITVVKGGNANAKANEINAISGATITSKAVQTMIANWMNYYKPYLQKIISGTAPEAVAEETPKTE